jgi:CO/xanthine dehydrogenase FAD-binding subunit
VVKTLTQAFRFLAEVLLNMIVAGASSVWKQYAEHLERYRRTIQIN